MAPYGYVTSSTQSGCNCDNTACNCSHGYEEEYIRVSNEIKQQIAEAFAVPKELLYHDAPVRPIMPGHLNQMRNRMLLTMKKGHR